MFVPKLLAIVKDILLQLVCIPCREDNLLCTMQIKARSLTLEQPMDARFVVLLSMQVCSLRIFV